MTPRFLLNPHIAPRLVSSILAATAAITAVSADYVYFTFAQGMPDEITHNCADGGPGLRTDMYNHLGKDLDGWFVDRVSGTHARVALSPTRFEGGAESQNMMRFTISINQGAWLCWDAKSMHKHISESYRVEVTPHSDLKSRTIYECDAESHLWTSHAVSLDAFAGEDVDIAFIATTADGFMLAVDNIMAGVPTEPQLTCRVLSQRFYGEDDTATIDLDIANYGSACDFSSFAITDSDGATIAGADGITLATGDSARLSFTIDPPMNEKYAYTVTGQLSDSTEIKLLDNGWVYRSHYARTSVVDRGSGTWCNNCPGMEISVTTLEEIYGNQIIPVEAHVNDSLADATYWEEYLSTFVYSIPMLTPNHQKGKIIYSLKSADDYVDNLAEETVAGISATSYISGGDIRIDTEVEFAMDIDNSTDRYRVGYMLLGDFHDANDPDLMQRNMSSDYRTDQYYYMPTWIMPELMYYTNVPVECTYATSGYPASLPAAITRRTAMSHTCSLPVPEADSPRAVAMVIDTETGYIVNACLASDVSTGSVTSAVRDTNKDGAWYTLQGIRLDSRPSTPGIYIHNGTKISISN